MYDIKPHGFRNRSRQAINSTFNLQLKLSRRYDHANNTEVNVIGYNQRDFSSKLEMTFGQKL